MLSIQFVETGTHRWVRTKIMFDNPPHNFVGIDTIMSSSTSPRGDGCRLVNTTSVSITTPDVIEQLDAAALEETSCSFTPLDLVAQQWLWLETLLQVDDAQIRDRLHEQVAANNAPTEQARNVPYAQYIMYHIATPRWPPCCSTAACSVTSSIWTPYACCLAWAP